MNRPYNRIVIVGNGLDLAAGLKTTYIDFLNAIIKEAFIEVLDKREYSSNLLSVHGLKGGLANPKEKYVAELDKLESPFRKLTYMRQITNIKFHHSFFTQIIEKLNSQGWVDLEQYYFEKLKLYFKNYGADHYKKSALKNIYELNKCMDDLTFAINDYLTNVMESANLSWFTSPLASLIERCKDPLAPNVANLVANHKRSNSPDQVVFLNFNYTNTILKLSDSSFSIPFKHIYIHGELNSTYNPIIFGYGDDTGEEYANFELTGEDELLRKIKSFQYPRTKNYHELLNILQASDFDVFIIGHSCGLSDKTLLSTIFEHKNCMCIKNFHYQGENEDFYKRMAISRHFSDKALMRERILPFDSKAEIPQV